MKNQPQRGCGVIEYDNLQNVSSVPISFAYYGDLCWCSYYVV